MTDEITWPVYHVGDVLKHTYKSTTVIGTVREVHDDRIYFDSIREMFLSHNCVPYIDLSLTPETWERLRAAKVRYNEHERILNGPAMLNNETLVSHFVGIQTIASEILTLLFPNK